MQLLYDTKKLRDIRRKRGLTQIDLHKLTLKAFPPDGVSLSAIRQIEVGMKNGQYVMWKIAQTLGIPLQALALKNGKGRR